MELKTLKSTLLPLCLHACCLLGLCGFAPLSAGTLDTNQCMFVWFQAASDALSSLGHVYTAIGDYPNALASHKQCVLLARQTQCQLSEARQLGNMGAVYTALGDFTNAVQCHEQHLGIAKVQCYILKYILVLNLCMS